MSDWEDLCEKMDLDNNEDALEKMIDQFIADDSLSKSDFRKPVLSVPKKSLQDDTGEASDGDGIPF